MPGITYIYINIKKTNLGNRTLILKGKHTIAKIKVPQF